MKRTASQSRYPYFGFLRTHLFYKNKPFAAATLQPSILSRSKLRFGFTRVESGKIPHAFSPCWDLLTYYYMQNPENLFPSVFAFRVAYTFYASLIFQSGDA